MRKSLARVDKLIVVIAIAIMYWYFGSGPQLPAYYQSEQRETRQNHELLRPLYSSLQRELVKSRLGLPFALDNLELIIRFAVLHSQIGHGILPDEVKALLQAVINTNPTQITALNLLAIDAYKRDQFPIALQYWRQILQIGSEHETVAVGILRQKVADLEKKINQFESIQTKT